MEDATTPNDKRPALSKIVRYQVYDLVTHPEVDVTLASRQNQLAVGGKRRRGFQAVLVHRALGAVVRGRAHAFSGQTCVKASKG